VLHTLQHQEVGVEARFLVLDHGVTGKFIATIYYVDLQWHILLTQLTLIESRPMIMVHILRLLPTFLLTLHEFDQAAYVHEPLLSPAFAQLDHEIVVLSGTCLLAEMAFLLVAVCGYV